MKVKNIFHFNYNPNVTVASAMNVTPERAREICAMMDESMQRAYECHFGSSSFLTNQLTQKQLNYLTSLVSSLPQWVADIYCDVDVHGENEMAYLFTMGFDSWCFVRELLVENDDEPQKMVLPIHLN